MDATTETAQRTPHPNEEKGKPSKQETENNGLKDYVEITLDRISIDFAVNYVGSPEAGAISTFSGTTRNNFEGKAVTKLEYEAYTPMAIKEMKKICNKMREKWPLIHIAIIHRIGEVPIGESSVLLAASSAHRTESLEAVHWAIDELKATVPIWKKEFYADGSASMWKENKECCFTHHQHKQEKHNHHSH
mmetsp:Transcript_25789/g.36266  ORF Transcript_25789/g.36266 Transcript_25789/m.36266 type:complete len:190 (-) Transcript_25789:571-1140(-)